MADPAAAADPAPADAPPFLSRRKTIALAVAVLLLAFLLYPFEEEPGVRWGNRVFVPASRPDRATFEVEPASLAGRFLFRRGALRGTGTYLMEVETREGAGFPRWGVRGRQVPGTPHPLYEIWLDAEAERRVRSGEYR